MTCWPNIIDTNKYERTELFNIFFVWQQPWHDMGLDGVKGH